MLSLKGFFVFLQTICLERLWHSALTDSDPDSCVSDCYGQHIVWRILHFCCLYVPSLQSKYIFNFLNVIYFPLVNLFCMLHFLIVVFELLGLEATDDRKVIKSHVEPGKMFTYCSKPILRVKMHERMTSLALTQVCLQALFCTVFQYFSCLFQTFFNWAHILIGQENLAPTFWSGLAMFGHFCYSFLSFFSVFIILFFILPSS